MQDRRKYRRLRYGVSVDISYYREASKKDDIISRLRTQDISAGGIRVIIPDKLDLDALVSVKLTIPGSEKEITCFAQVAWTEKADDGLLETGLAFMNLSNREAVSIEDFVQNELEKGIE